MENCYFAYINLLLFCRTRCLSPSSLPKLLIVVIQKFCFHGNLTSHFSITTVNKERAGNKIASEHTTYANRKLSNRGIYGGTTQPLNNCLISHIWKINF